MDERLVFKIGKQEFVRLPIVGECATAECPKRFTPVPPEDGKTFCQAYLKPATMWMGKNCPLAYKPEIEEAHKMNPVKASKRGIKFPTFAEAIGRKEQAKK